MEDARSLHPGYKRFPLPRPSIPPPHPRDSGTRVFFRCGGRLYAVPAATLRVSRPSERAGTRAQSRDPGAPASKRAALGSGSRAVRAEEARTALARDTQRTAVPASHAHTRGTAGQRHKVVVARELALSHVGVPAVPLAPTLVAPVPPLPIHNVKQHVSSFPRAL